MDSFWDVYIIPNLSQFITIPNQSPAFDPEWETNGLLLQAANHIQEWVLSLNVSGLQSTIISDAGKPPLLFITIDSFLSGAGNVLLYGHYDKQPPLDGWSDGLGPYTPYLDPVTKKLYGRGSVDDGYAVYGSLAVFQYLQSQSIPHPRASIIIEGGEESGSVDLIYFLDLLSEEIGQPDMVICLDSGAGNYEQMFMTTSLRGGVTANVAFDVVKQAVHSGSTGGMVTDSFRAARRFLDFIEDSITGEILLSAFHVDIPQNRIDEAIIYAEELGTAVYDWIPFVDGVGPTTSNITELILAKTWKPTLTVTGADGLPPTISASNVIRSFTDLKLSFRLPPTANSQAALTELEMIVSEIRFHDGSISFTGAAPSSFNGWNAVELQPWLSEVVNTASLTHFGKGVLYTGEGGSIPFIGGLQDLYPNAQFVVTGALGPNSNAHSTDESLDTTYAKSLNACMVDIVQALDSQLRVY